MNKGGSGFPGSEPAAAHSGSSRQSSVVERLSRYDLPLAAGASQRRSRLQRQQEAAPERASITSATRRKYLKELLLSRSSHSGFGCYSESSSQTRSSTPESEQDAGWALCPMEHAWLLSAVEGNYDTILEFISEEPCLLTRRDFVSGYSVLHWLAKRGQDETLLRLLRFAEGAGLPVNVNLRGSGGLTPLHVASMHGQFPVVKLLVGAFGADVDVMDYSGRRAWQYLKEDAPVAMKELLGTWDDEHSLGCAPSVNENANNNCAGAAEEQSGEPEDLNQLDQIRRAGWRFGSFKKLISSLSFHGPKT